MKSFKKHLHHFFVPHHGNNHRAKLLHHSSLLIILVALLGMTFISKELRTHAPDILGINYSITEYDLLKHTNEQRAQHNLPPLDINNSLAEAAKQKAGHMLQNGYWAHFSPDGTSPWVFIKGQGYQYRYAGENLAKGFTDSGDIVNAWMNSESHRENILSDKYQEIGFAIQEGELLGEETVLVVQMFGATDTSLARAQDPPPQEPQIQEETTSDSNPQAEVQSDFIPRANAQETVEINTQAVTADAQIDADTISKIGTLAFVSVILFALLSDFIVVGARKIPRMVGDNVDHILLVSIFIVFVIIYKNGGII